MSSPRGSPSPNGSPQSPTSNVLTPSRKVQELLAQFDDSDSDSPFERPGTRSDNRQGQIQNAQRPAGQAVASQPQDDSEEEDILPAAPRSRIAARLQGVAIAPTASNDDRGKPASTDMQQDVPMPSEHSEDEGPIMRRRLLTKRKIKPMQSPPAPRGSRSPSADTLPSLSAIRRDPSTTQQLHGSESEEGPRSSPAGKSKFLALVEKHRRQRLEKEAEEAAKKAARLEAQKSQETTGRLPRGSSPADDSDEDSDIFGDDASEKLAKQARPSRKASKKAIEEMNRETQRITRNMQLAHQARTKKKITKASLLARFNFSTSASSRDQKSPEPDSHLVTGSSRAGSDTEANKGHSTPPTSPMVADNTTDRPKTPTSQAVDTRHGSGSEAGSEAGSEGEENSFKTGPKVDKGKGRALSVEPFPDIQQVLAAQPVDPLTVPSLVQNSSDAPQKPTVKPFQSKWSALALKNSEDDDTDSDLEVVTSRGEVRKYAAFEHLPRRKAKEAPSHLALRSLANLIGSEERKSSMNAAQMEAALRKAARMQARQERQEKIEELKARGVMIQTAEEREREQQEVEDLLERARQEAVEIQKREKALAKKEGTLSKDGLNDDEDDESDADFEDDEAEISLSGEDEDREAEEDDEGEGEAEDAEDGDAEGGALLDAEADEEEDLEEGSQSDNAEAASRTGGGHDLDGLSVNRAARRIRTNRVLSDDDDDEDEEDLNAKPRSPQLPAPAKTPQSLSRSARKQIPGLQMSDDLPIGLTQAFAATMADSQSQLGQEQDSLTMTMDLPSPNIAMVPKLNRLDSVDMISDSQPASQTQPLNVDLSFSQSQRDPQTPGTATGAAARQFTPSQAAVFDPTQDNGYMMTPFAGNRFATETPLHPGPQSTIDTVLLAEESQNSPIMQRRARLRRGHANSLESDEEQAAVADVSAFDVMRRATKRKEREAFERAKSHAREIVDEAAEESEDEYAGLGGASDEDINDEENEEDRKMIDEDTQIGVGDEAKLAKLFADRERQQDEAAVSKLLKDITTGALRRKRGNDDLDLSDEEDALVRRREAKRREFARMRRELLKDEAVGKIAEDKKKEAFLRSLEDRPVSDDEDDDFDLPETPLEEESQQAADPETQPKEPEAPSTSKADRAESQGNKQPLSTAPASKLNQMKRSLGRGSSAINRRPTTLAEIRESVSFLIEEPDSQASMIDLGLSDSEDEPEAYVDLDRHLQAAEADENADDGEDLGDFIVDDNDGNDGASQEKSKDESSIFKKPAVPYSRAAYSERRTKERPNVVNRLSMLRQSSSSSSNSSSNTKMAFYMSTSMTSTSSFSKVPALLRRATTKSSLGSMAIGGRDENVSATGVVTNNRTERSKPTQEKEFVRKSTGGQRAAVNYRPTIREEKMSQRAGVAKKMAAAKNKKTKGGFLGGLFQRDSWA
ncbi:hypothetical protein ABEF95_015203 [Exophiala dermatitidis]